MPDVALQLVHGYTTLSCVSGGRLVNKMSPPPNEQLRKLAADMEASSDLHKMQVQLASLIKIVRAQDQSIKAMAEPSAPEPWFKRYSILISVASTLVVTIGAWWVSNDRTMNEMRIQRQYQQDADEKRFKSVESRIGEIEGSKKSDIEEVIRQSNRLTRIEVMIENLNRHEGIRTPPPIEDKSGEQR